MRSKNEPPADPLPNQDLLEQYLSITLSKKAFDKQKQLEYIDMLIKAYNPRAAAYLIAINYDVIQQYILDSKEFREKVIEARKVARGLAEAALFNEAIKGKPVPGIYFLKNNSKKYREGDDKATNGPTTFMVWGPATTANHVIEGEVRELPPPEITDG